MQGPVNGVYTKVYFATGQPMAPKNLFIDSAREILFHT
jgi:hypothetical protein